MIYAPVLFGILVLIILAAWPKRDWDPDRDLKRCKKSQADYFRWLGDEALPWQKRLLEELEKEGW